MVHQALLVPLVRQGPKAQQVRLARLVPVVRLGHRVHREYRDLPVRSAQQGRPAQVAPQAHRERPGPRVPAVRQEPRVQVDLLE